MRFSSGATRFPMRALKVTAAPSAAPPEISAFRQRIAFVLLFAVPLNDTRRPRRGCARSRSARRPAAPGRFPPPHPPPNSLWETTLALAVLADDPVLLSSGRDAQRRRDSVGGRNARDDGEIRRLLEEVRGTESLSGEPIVLVRERGEHDDRCIGREHAGRRRHLEAAVALRAQADVGDDEVHRAVAEAALGVSDRGSGDRLDAIALEQLDETFANRFLVLDEQDRFLLHDAPS